MIFLSIPAVIYASADSSVDDVSFCRPLIERADG
jgi:hypothetical protein